MQNRTMLALGGAFAAFALTGCGNSQPPPTTVVTTPPTTVTTAPPALPPGGPDTKINNNAGPGTSNGTDQATADAVNTAIVHNKEMTGSRVDAVVTGGVARLTGTVQNGQQKALAATAAMKTPGVTSVVNKLLIDATGGVHSAMPKVVNHTTVINHYITVPGGSGGSSGSGMSGGSGGTSGDNGGGASGSGSGTSGGGSDTSGSGGTGASSGDTGSGGGTTGGGGTGASSGGTGSGTGGGQ